MLDLIRARSLALILAGAAIALALSLTSTDSSAQFTASAQSIGKWWPPHPSDQVQFAAESLPLAVGAEIELAVVPLDRWLVIVPPSTGIALSSLLSSKLKVYQDLGGVLELRAAGSPSGSAPVRYGPDGLTSLGWTFSPGSRVIIKNTDTGSGELINYNLFGYYVDA